MAAKGRQVGEAVGVVPRLAAGPWEARTASYVAVDLVDPSPGAVAAVPGAVVVADSRAAFPSSQAVLVVAATSLPPVDYRVQVVQTLSARVLLQASCNLITWQGNQACRPQLPGCTVKNATRPQTSGLG
jgi:hypothetical protein